MTEYLSPTDQHLVNVLTNYYLDIQEDFSYYMTYSTWLIAKGYVREVATLGYKTDEQLNKLLVRAYKNADSIKNSKLSKAMR